MKLSQKENVLILIVIVSYAVGLIGIISPLREFFLWLTPIHLFIVGLLLLHEAQYSTRLLYYAVFVVSLGWCIESIGVNTGIIFGSYSYGSVLGWKVAGTPLIIGVNWFILTYSLSCIVRRFSKSYIVQATLVAISMTLFDVILEPVAVKLGYWFWVDKYIPIQNYIAWFFISWIFAYIGIRAGINRENKLVLSVFLSMTTFFLLLSC